MWSRRIAVAAAVSAFACNSSFRFDEPRGDAGTSQCTRDTDCVVAGLRCNTITGQCVACLETHDCTTVGNRCDPNQHVCVECTDQDDCRAQQRCDLDTKRCLDTCVSADDVCTASGFSCDPTHQLCVECTVSASCAGSARGSRCDPTIGLCVECVANAQCPVDTPVCDLRQGKCVGCVTGSDCPTRSVCDPQRLTCIAI